MIILNVSVGCVDVVENVCMLNGSRMLVIMLYVMFCGMWCISWLKYLDMLIVRMISVVVMYVLMVWLSVSCGNRLMSSVVLGVDYVVMMGILSF